MIGAALAQLSPGLGDIAREHSQERATDGRHLPSQPSLQVGRFARTKSGLYWRAAGRQSREFRWGNDGWCSDTSSGSVVDWSSSRWRWPAPDTVFLDSAVAPTPRGRYRGISSTSYRREKLRMPMR